METDRSIEANAQPEQPAVPESAAIEEQEKALYDFFRRLAIRRMKVGKYKTDDMVALVGGFKTSEKLLTINGLGPIHLTPGQFVLLLILAAHARTRQKLSTPRIINGGTFLSTQEILDAIDTWKKEDPALRVRWDKPTLHRTICELRVKIRNAFGNPNLVETAESGLGYRLSTSAFNIDIGFHPSAEPEVK